MNFTVQTNVPDAIAALTRIRQVFVPVMQPDLTEAAADASGLLERLLRAAAPRGARPREPKLGYSGHFADNIESNVALLGPYLFIEAEAPDPLWRFILEGTPAHEIYPREKRALWWPGLDHPVDHVNHPGTQPNPFHVAPAEEATASLVEGLLRVIVERIARA